MTVSKKLQEKIICPRTKRKLVQSGEYLENVLERAIKYPIIDGIPILINASNSLFSIDDFTNKKDTTFKTKSAIRKTLSRFIPRITLNIGVKERFDKLVSLLPRNSKILVIGGGIRGDGTASMYSAEDIEIIGSDVSFQPYTDIISDAHDIPFEDATFDCVVFQAVLEHVLDPQRCVNEAHRVLKPDGLIYAETPFMQQVHMGRYDFMRFTYLGHRRLFSGFEEIKSGPCCGPGTALAWSYKYFLRSFARSKATVKILELFATVTSFYLKYFDYLLINKPGAYDAAAGFYFFGRKSEKCLLDTDLIMQFKGIDT